MSLCANCESAQSVVECRTCNKKYCQECDTGLHRSAKKRGHTRVSLAKKPAPTESALKSDVVQCANCAAAPAEVECRSCTKKLCRSCSDGLHRSKRMRGHVIVELGSSSSVAKPRSPASPSASIRSQDDRSLRPPSPSASRSASTRQPAHQSAHARTTTRQVADADVINLLREINSNVNRLRDDTQVSQSLGAQLQHLEAQEMSYGPSLIKAPPSVLTHSFERGFFEISLRMDALQKWQQRTLEHVSRIEDKLDGVEPVTPRYRRRHERSEPSHIPWRPGFAGKTDRFERLGERDTRYVARKRNDALRCDCCGKVRRPRSAHHPSRSRHRNRRTRYYADDY